MCKTIATIKTNVFVALCAMLLLVSCKPGVPGDYLQPGKMADILYEFQLAQTLNLSLQALEGRRRSMTSKVAIRSRCCHTGPTFSRKTE